MLKVGLTGGIASGKSTVLAMFAQRGALTLEADEVAHRLIEPGQPVYDAVVAAFGRAILDRSGHIVHARLAAAAFPARIEELNRLIHPAVLDYERDWMRQAGERDRRAIAICEAALLLEAGGRARYDRLIVVASPLEQKFARYAARHNLSLDAAEREVRRRLAAQMSEEEKARLADFVIDNRTTRDAVAQQVEAIWQALAREVDAQPH